MKAKVKEVATPKFYFFDCGVVRSLRGELNESLDASRGYQLETLILNELKAYASYCRVGWEFFYWGTPSGNEVDFIFSSGKKRLGLEVKSNKTWRSEFGKGLRALLEEKN